MTTPIRTHRSTRVLFVAAAWLFAATAGAATVTRGPYLQQGTPTSVIVRWRTDVATDSLVQWGTSPGSLTSSVTGDLAVPTKEHQLTITGLSPATRYFYSVGSVAAVLSSGSDHVYQTGPAVGSQAPFRVWATGDFGSAAKTVLDSPPDPNAALFEQAVRDSYRTFTNQYQTYTNVWLMLGDNAYVSGSDKEYQVDVFDPTYAYQTLLRQTVAWPTLGNHDANASPTPTNPGPTIPYFLSFTLPANGEAGGQPSGTEHYYSFDYANVHFVCLDAQTASNRQPGSPMLVWLANDLSSTAQDWIIAYWHQPPYSSSTHYSDTEIELKEMRQNVVPILENHGVDLVLGAHSHGYERTFLIDGHYGTHSTWNPTTMAKDLGDGRVDGTGAYTKPTPGVAPHEGAVYVVMGASGEACTTKNKCGGLSNPYPMMEITVPGPKDFPVGGTTSFPPKLGSLVLDIQGKRLDARFLRDTGAIDDHFTIIKGPASPGFGIDDVSVVEGNSGTTNAVFTVSLSGPVTSAATVSYATADGTAVAGSDYMAVSGTLTFPAGVTTKTISVPVNGDLVPEGNETFFLGLANATNALIVDNQGRGTIVDDDSVSTFVLSVARNGTGSGTVTSTPAGINCGATCSASVNAGTVISLTATPNAGSTFTGWSGACSGSGACQVTMDAAKSVTAAFTLSPATFVLSVARNGTGTGTVTSTPAGINCGTTCSASVNAGTAISLTATPNAGSTFTGWSGACSGSGTCQVTMDAAKAVTAAFALSPTTFVLSVARNGTGSGTVTSTPAGINCGATCSTSVNAGTVISLTATPNAGSTFTAWSGACSGSGTCQLTMDAAKSVTAAFALQGGTTTVFETRVSAPGDDAEEMTGVAQVSSAKLDLGADSGTPQLVGMRFNALSIPKGATIVTAWVQFKAYVTDSSACALNIQGEASDNPLTFKANANNLSARPRTAASVGWTPPSWTLSGQVGPAQQTASLVSVIQELVNRAGWVPGNSVALIVTGTGHRGARAYEGGVAGAPLLHVEYR